MEETTHQGIHSVADSLADVRRDLSYLLLTALSVLALPALFVSLARARIIGWQPIMGLHVALVLTLWSVLLLRRRLPPTVPAASLLVLFYITGVAGLLQFGLDAGSVPLLIIAPILGQLLLGYRLALALVLMTVGTLMAGGLLLSYGKLPMAVDLNDYYELPGAWFNYAAVTAFALIALLLSLRNFWRRLAQQEIGLVEAQSALLESHAQLERRVEERTASLEDLRTSLERVMELARLGTWSMDRADQKVQWSGAALEILSAEAASGDHTLEPLLSALAPAQALELEPMIQRALKGRDGFDYRARLLPEPGRPERHVHLVGETDTSGQHLLGYVRDDTERELNRQALEEERERLREIIEATRSGTWEWHIETGETIFNERWANMVGYTLDELQPTTIDTWMSLGHPEDLKESARLLERNFSGELDYYECACRMRHRDGRWIWLLDRGKVVERAADGRPLRMAGTHSDIHEQKMLQRDLEQQKLLLEEMGKMALIGAWSYDPGSATLEWSTQTRRLHEVGDDYVPEVETALEFYAPEDRSRVQVAVEHAITQGIPYDLEVRLVTARGREIAVRTLGERVTQPDDSLGLVGTIQDISRQRALEADLKRLARTDSLTGLANRGEFERRLDEALKLAQRQGTTFAVMVLDLNRFKPINDHYGHPVGDRVLQWIAEAWQRQMRGHDVLARVGGDEFAVLVLDARHTGDVESLATRLEKTLEDVPAALAIDAGPTVAIGTAHYPQDGTDRESLVRIADRNMYGAKRAQRGTVNELR